MSAAEISSDRTYVAAISPYLRRFPFAKNVVLELRAESINITNTPNFAKPNATVTAYGGTSNPAGRNVATSGGGFGSITNTAFGYSGR